MIVGHALQQFINLAFGKAADVGAIVDITRVMAQPEQDFRKVSAP